MEQFMSWLARHDITVDAVVPFDFPDTGRGMRATRDISPGELLLKIPEYLIISAKTALDSDIGPFFREAKIRNGVDLICLYLLYEKNKPNSAWKEYINILPTSFSDLLHFTDEELQELQCSVKTERLNTKKISLQNKYQTLKSSLETVMKRTLLWLTFDEYLWAWSCVMSRSFYIPGRKRMNIEKDEYNVIPFADMFNHSSNVESRGAFGPNSGAYKLFTDTAYKQGDQVFLCYGQHSNEVLLKYYGFVIEDNRYNSIRFHIDWSAFPGENKNAKLALIQDYHVAEGKYVGLEEEFSWNMMTCLRIMLSDSNESEDWARAILEDVISRENELKVWDYLQNLLRERAKDKIATVKEDMALLSTETNFNKRNAITLRIGEKKILDSLLTLCGQRLR
jgi:hypothetical protein